MMSLSDSPQFGDELESPQDSPPPVKRSRTRIVMIVLAAAVLIGAGALLLTNINIGSQTTGTATVQGQIVSAEGDPVPDVYVSIEGLTTMVVTDESGAFSISSAPQGRLVLVIGVTPEPPQFIDIEVQGDAADLGAITLESS
jgi:hypothetical protein